MLDTLTGLVWMRRVVSPVMKQAPGTDVLPHVQRALETIGGAKVSSSAEEARSFGFLSESDRVVMNRDHLLYEAKAEVLSMSAAGYVPPAREHNCYAAGRGVRAGLKAAIYIMQQGGYMSEYDAFISGRLAHVLCGGELSSGQWLDEQYFLDLERAVFVELSRNPKTHERIKHMLETGKPLRN